MLVKAKTKINYGGIVHLEEGETAEVKDEIAKKLLLLKHVELVPSYKKMKVKKEIILPDKED